MGWRFVVDGCSGRTDLVCQPALTGLGRTDGGGAVRLLGLAGCRLRVVAIFLRSAATAAHGEPGLLADVIDLVRKAAQRAGFDIGDVVVPAGDVFGRGSRPDGPGLFQRRGA